MQINYVTGLYLNKIALFSMCFTCLTYDISTKNCNILDKETKYNTDGMRYHSFVHLTKVIFTPVRPKIVGVTLLPAVTSMLGSLVLYHILLLLGNWGSFLNLIFMFSQFTQLYIFTHHSHS